MNVNNKIDVVIVNTVLNGKFIREINSFGEVTVYNSLNVINSFLSWTLRWFANINTAHIVLITINDANSEPINA